MNPNLSIRSPVPRFDPIPDYASCFILIPVENRFKDRLSRIKNPQPMTKIHPLPKKRSLLRHPSRQKKLRRLPHIFEKVLELPLNSNADVDVQERPDSFRFSVLADGLSEEIRAQAIEIYPGVTKVVIRGENEQDVFEDDGLEIDLWRFRLPICTRPERASAAWIGGELVVVVPKDESFSVVNDDQDESD